MFTTEEADAIAIGGGFCAGFVIPRGGGRELLAKLAAVVPAPLQPYLLYVSDGSAVLAVSIDGGTPSSPPSRVAA
jgi:hypothetical protein